MMRKIYKSLSLFAFLLAFGWVGAQTVSGKITDPDGLGVPGATVVVKGTTNTTDTDIDGNFTLQNVASNATLVVTALDLDAKEMAVNGQSVVNFAMTRPQSKEEKALKEVVVIGYGSVKKKDATGAVAVISSADFNKGVTTSPDQLLQGRVSGVNVTSTSGEPGAGSDIRIRGVGSIRAGNGPLYVIDGVPIVISASPGGNSPAIGSSAARNPLNFINSSDIESISVLKDASASAIYGARGANGVVIVTTKKGKKGVGRLTLDASTSFSTIANRIEVLSGDQFAQLNPSRVAGGTNGGVRENVNAMDQILRTGITQNYGLSYSGGSDTGSYRVSIGVLDQQGILKQSGLKKHTVNSIFSQKFFDDIIKLDVSFGASLLNDEGNGNSDNSGFEGSIITSALRWNPTLSFYNADGTYYQTTSTRNPLAFLDYFTDKTRTVRAYGNIVATANLSTITKGLEYKFTYGLDGSTSKRTTAISRLFNANGILQVPDPTDGDKLKGGFLGLQNQSDFYQLFQHTFSYKTNVTDKLVLDGLLGYSYERNTFDGESNQVFKFTRDDQQDYIENQYLGQDRPRVQYTRTGVPTSIQSYFARGIFTYANKYILTGTIRRDGSSRFGSDNQYGWFPSAAFAWKVQEEGFLPDAINELKLRAGWGITGNQDFDPLAAKQVYEYNDDGSYRPYNFENSELKWESTTSLNVGIDFGIFKDFVSGSIDWYKKTTNDLLFRKDVAQPGPQSGSSWENLSDFNVINTGLELGLNFKLFDKEDFSWNIGGNVTFQTNKVQDDGSIKQFIPTGFINGQGLSNQNAQLLYDGQSIGAFYLPVFDGFNANGSERFKDINGDGIVNTGFDLPGKTDRAFVGSALPDVIVGLTTNVNYKNWDFSVNMNGAYGHYVYNNTANALFNGAAFKSGANVTQSVVDEGDYLQTSPTLSMNSRYLEKADFLRLSNVTLGYTLNGGSGKFISWVKSMRLYVTGQNLAVITPYSGFDPEVNINKAVGGVSSFGIDYSAYPKSRTYTFGVNINF